MPASCYKKGYESGPWFEIKTVTDIIKLKEATGKDTKFERELLKAWNEYPGYEAINDMVDTLFRPIDYA